MFLVSQEILCILWNPKVPHGIYKRQPNVPILSQINPIHTSPSHLLNFHFHIILPSTPRFCRWYISLTFLHQSPTWTSSLPHAYYLAHLPQSSWVYSVGSTARKAPSYVVFSTPLYLVPFKPKYSPQHPILEHPQPRFLPKCEWPSFTPIHNNRQNYSYAYLSLYIRG